VTDSWYALRVKPRFERLVTLQLDQKGYETLLPTYVSTRRWSDRIKKVSLPMFPGYVFCRFDLHARLPILVTPGVTAILGAGRHPASIDESEIAALQHVVHSGAKAQPCPYVNVGEMVRVKSGPLKGLIGIVVRLKGADRLIISVRLLMRSIAVEVEASLIGPLKDTERHISDFEKISPSAVENVALV